MRDFIPIVVLIAMRLCIAPILAFLIISVIPFGFTEDIKNVLIILAGTPVAVNVMMIALEYERNAEFASQIVFWTTLLSAASISVMILILI
jgi:predicted permease